MELTVKYRNVELKDFDKIIKEGKIDLSNVPLDHGHFSLRKGSVVISDENVKVLDEHGNTEHFLPFWESISILKSEKEMICSLRGRSAKETPGVLTVVE